MSQEEALLQEINEEAQRQQFKEIWHKYGKFFVAFAIAVVLASISINVAKYFEHKKDLKATEQIVNVLKDTPEADQLKAATTLVDLSKKLKAPHNMIAKLNAANLYAQNNMVQEATKLYDEIAADKGTPKEYKDLVTILAVFNQLDTANPKDLEDKLQAFTKDNNPWRFSAKELLAFVYIKQGKKAEAKEIFKNLMNDKDAPSGIRSRTSDLYTLYQ